MPLDTFGLHFKLSACQFISDLLAFGNFHMPLRYLISTVCNFFFVLVQFLIHLYILFILLHNLYILLFSSNSSTLILLGRYLCIFYLDRLQIFVHCLFFNWLFSCIWSWTSLPFLNSLQLPNCNSDISCNIFSPPTHSHIFLLLYLTLFFLDSS